MHEPNLSGNDSLRACEHFAEAFHDRKLELGFGVALNGNRRSIHAHDAYVASDRGSQETLSRAALDCKAATMHRFTAKVI